MSNDATLAPARKTAAPRATQKPAPASRSDVAATEADALARKAAASLFYTVLNTTHCGTEERYRCPSLDRAARILGHLEGTVADELEDLPGLDASSMADMLSHINNNLELAREQFNPDACASAGEAVYVSLLIDHAEAFSGRLCVAYANAKHDLGELRAMTTYAGPRPYHDRPTPPIRRDPEAAQEVGVTFSRAQLAAVLEVVAGNMATLGSILAMALTSDGEWERLNLISAAQSITTSVGSVADHAVGDSVIGDIGRWHGGPNFHALGAKA
ncbi:hypothetical protein EDF72_1231 [Delftia acidovorans]|uniref:hypothetical protein n=1 Tax=Delftia acidovorans TaxID=80866 RepID=UPI000F4BD30F|nr:hypothetical protein [Delftia acidovorans]ROR02113.1 hypothetical protein EDF72_1231 [Delftia acidovorans]